MTLKALLEDPNLKNPAFMLQSSDQIKIKKEESSTSHNVKVKEVNEAPRHNYGSAFLGANLWDKSYADIDFNLEYMDLDEFLSENGIDGEDGVKDQMSSHVNITDPVMVNTNYGSSGLVNPNSPRHFLRTPPISPRQVAAGPSDLPTPSFAPSTSSSFLVNRQAKTPSPPVSPFRVEYQVSEQDLALSSIPGQDISFDPRKRNFSEEELKPQPIIKKSKKVFVPEDCKDEKYWNRRHKNNFAAKRSRDARRVKENQIAMRAAYLEKENGCLRDEVNKLRKENAKLKNKVEIYEGGNDAVSSSLPSPQIIAGPSSPISVTSLAFS